MEAHRKPMAVLSASTGPEDKAVLAERQRTLQILDSLKDSLGIGYLRAKNLVANGMDAAEEASAPEHDRNPFWQEPGE